MLDKHPRLSRLFWGIPRPGFQVFCFLGSGLSQRKVERPQVTAFLVVGPGYTSGIILGFRLGRSVDLTAAMALDPRTPRTPRTPVCSNALSTVPCGGACPETCSSFRPAQTDPPEDCKLIASIQVGSHQMRWVPRRGLDDDMATGWRNGIRGQIPTGEAVMHHLAKRGCNESRGQ